jgi:hypothetical protein
LLQVDYLSGQGRAVGDLTAVIRQVTFRDQFGVAETQLQAERKLPLAGFTTLIVNINVPFTGQNSRLFETFQLNFLRFEMEGDQGGTAQTFNTAFVQFPGLTLPLAFPARVRTFPGRQTILPIFVDNSMFEVREQFAIDPSTGDPLLDEEGNFVPTGNQYLQVTPSATSSVSDVFGRGEVDPNDPQSSIFGQVNLPDANNDGNPEQQILGFLSDYLVFDISSMPAGSRPNLLNGTPAQRVFFSGDGFAIAGNPGTEGDLESLALDVEQPIPGTYQDAPGSLNAPGTYNLLQIDPRDINRISRIVSLQGIWRNFDEVLSGMGSTEAITFPSSRDDGRQDIVFFAPGGAGVTRLYFGTADLETGTFEAFPVRNLATGAVENRVTGTLGGYKDRNGAATRNEPSIRSGTYSFNGDSGGFPTTGRFTVYRR